MTHRGPFQPLQFCDSVIENNSLKGRWYPASNTGLVVLHEELQIFFLILFWLHGSM